MVEKMADEMDCWMVAETVAETVERRADVKAASTDALSVVVWVQMKAASKVAEKVLRWVEYSAGGWVEG